jgi:hypothetical protein
MPGMSLTTNVNYIKENLIAYFDIVQKDSLPGGCMTASDAPEDLTLKHKMRLIIWMEARTIPYKPFNSCMIPSLMCFNLFLLLFHRHRNQGAHHSPYARVCRDTVFICKTRCCAKDPRPRKAEDSPHVMMTP